MNEAEAVLLTRYVRALCPAQKIDEYTADAWYDVLGSYELHECKFWALRIKTEGETYVDPAEIIKRIEYEAVMRRHRERMAEEHARYLEPLRERQKLMREGADPRPLRESIDEIMRENGWPPQS